MAKEYSKNKKNELNDNKVTSYDPVISSGKARGDVRDEDVKTYTSSADKKKNIR